MSAMLHSGDKIAADIPAGAILAAKKKEKILEINEMAMSAKRITQRGR